MIKFFRKIRQDLLSKGKTGKYLKYAIGEIVLVVIGILIALGINNWNENRKQNNIIRNFYYQLEGDLDDETHNLKTVIIRIDESINSYEEYLELTKASNLKLIEMINALTEVKLAFWYPSFNSNTIGTLETTGDIKLMPSLIRQKLISLIRKQEGIVSQANGNYSVYLSDLQKAGNLGFYRNNYHLKENSHLNYTENYPEIILTLENALYLKNYTEKRQLIELKKMLNDVNELKELIKIEINKK
ncbi:DUF6090 family protein [Winogradskyella flava]|uniref:Uncharacterized protein n=1 Tax=Winogradskyella flava TaxID=1884876 RepID=A0A842IYJ5_9FLAO|nr:DUF6090 family protein [Winogradskyella flava]MBC2846743.1 hypothetical protein [Winogradskyella flava]